MAEILWPWGAAATITGEAGKTYTQGFVYDGTTFKPLGGASKID